MPSPNALPSQLNSAGSNPFASNEGLEISNADPLEELLDEEELLDDVLLLDELLELEELDELLELDEELLVLDVELLDELLELPPQPTMAADSKVMLQAKAIFFMIVSHLKSQ